jgi:hypothetical protein
VEYVYAAARRSALITGADEVVGIGEVAGMGLQQPSTLNRCGKLLLF